MVAAAQFGKHNSKRVSYGHSMVTQVIVNVERTMYNIIYFGPKILKITGNSLILSNSMVYIKPETRMNN